MTTISMPDTSADSGAPFLDEVLKELRKKVRKEKYETWFRGFQVARVAADEIEFAVPNGFIRDWLTRHYLQLIEQSVHIALGAPARLPRVRITFARGETGDGEPRVADAGFATSGTAPNGEPAEDCSSTRNGVTPAPLEIEIDPPASATFLPANLPPAPAAASSASPTFAAPSSAAPAPVAPRSPSPAPSFLHPRSTPDTVPHDAALNSGYTFDLFVVGSCNRLSHAAALAVGEHPGRSYNPLFIHGNVGLGKTHLLQAICHAMLRKQPDAKVIYLSCEDFTNRFIRSIENKNVDEFRAYHRSADILVVDDVEFLASKGKTQEEFFHTFNDLFNRNRQIVLSSDRPPPEIPTLEDRLVSRFKWGLVADIEPPCFETRVAIVKRKARVKGHDLPDDVAHYVARRVDTNIRELEGALTRVLGYAAITEQEIGLAVAEEALRDTSARKPAHFGLPDVMALVTNEFSISAREITGKSRMQAISFPRQLGMYLAREHTDHSLEEIGRFFGNRDHTTVMYSVARIKARIGQDRMLKDLIASLVQRLQKG